MLKEYIVIKGVKEYNFKNIDLVFLWDKFIVFIGFFGFGKLFLVFDIIYVEG